MIMYLYQMTQEKNRIKKNVSGGVKFEGTLRADSDIVNPSIMVEASANTVCGYNYAYIPDFKRYYFINNTNAYRTGLSIISCTVDVLTSFQTTILNSNCIISRSSRSGDTEVYFDLPDDRFPVKQSETTHVISYPELYSNTDPTKAQSLILVMTGITPNP